MLHKERGPAKSAWGAGGLKNQYSSSQATLGSDANMTIIFDSYLTELRLKRGIWAENNFGAVIVTDIYISLSTSLAYFLA